MFFPQGRVSEELVLFHSSSVWICTVHSHCRGTADCARASTTADNLPTKLEPDSEVFFTARRIPLGAVYFIQYTYIMNINLFIIILFFI